MDQNLTCVLHGTADGWPNASMRRTCVFLARGGLRGMAAGIPAVRHGKRQARLGYRMDRKPLLCQCGIHRAHAVLEQGLYGAGLPAHITWAGTDQRTASFLYSTRPFGRLGRRLAMLRLCPAGTTAPMFRKQVPAGRASGAGKAVFLRTWLP